MASSGVAVAHETVKSVMAEFIGSFLFQFLGGACISNATEHGLGSGAIGNGFAFAIVLYAVTNVSGGHVNPAITAAFRATHRISNANAVAFVCAQIIGSIIGAGFLRLCLPASSPAFITIGSLTDSEPGMTLIWEFLSTFFVVFVVYAVTFNKDFRPIGPFAIGVRQYLHSNRPDSKWSHT
jgi:glycerol uptake facilitator-like aquaporin